MFRLLTATRRNCWWSLQESSEVKRKHNVSLSSELFYDVFDRNVDIPEPTHRLLLLFQGRNNSVGVALDCRAGGRGLDFRGRTNTQGRKITKNRRNCVGPANGYTLGGLDDHVKWRSCLRSRRKLGVLNYYFLRTFFFAEIDFWHYLFLANCASELGFTTPNLSYTAYKRTRGL